MLVKCLFLLFILAVPVSTSAQSLDTAVNEMASEIARGTATKIAILEFSYTDGKESPGPAIIQERITTALVKRHLGIIVERKLLDRVMGELKLQHSGSIDPATIKQIGRVLGADYVVTGTLNDVNETLTEVNARIIRTETAEVISASSAQIQKTWSESPPKAAAASHKEASAGLIRTKAYMDARLADLRGDVGTKIKSTDDGNIVVNDSVTANTEAFSDAVMRTILKGVKESGLEEPLMGKSEEDTGNQ